MYEYYFKIKKGDIEFECSTSDKQTFEEQLSDWINGVVKGEYVAPPEQQTENITENITENKAEPKDISEDKPQRSGFIDVKNLVSVNDMSLLNTNTINFYEEKQELPVQNFEQVLEESINNPKTEVVEKTDNVSDFYTYLYSYNPQSSLDYLIITAMYILNKENKELFSIKQINAKLVPLNNEPITHAVIEEAINQNLIKIVPDLTGTSEFTEYTLTQDGEGYFVE